MKYLKLKKMFSKAKRTNKIEDWDNYHKELTRIRTKEAHKMWMTDKYTLSQISNKTGLGLEYLQRVLVHRRIFG